MLGFVEFQNGTWNWKLWKLPNQSVFLSARALRQVSFEYLQGYIFHSLPGKLIPVLDQIIGKKKKFSYDEMNFLVFQFVSLDTCSISGYHWKTVSIFFTFAYQKFMHMDKIPLISLFSKLENSNCLCLSFLWSLSPCST